MPGTERKQGSRTQERNGAHREYEVFALLVIIEFDPTGPEIPEALRTTEILVATTALVARERAEFVSTP